MIIDADGKPTRDPTDFYGPPAGGLLPLGGPVGHKGYALGVMIEMLAGGLSGAGYVSEAAVTHGNGVLFQVMNIAAFEDIDNFKRRTRELIAHVKSARPRAGVDEVLFPGRAGISQCEAAFARWHRAAGAIVGGNCAELAAELGLDREE